MYLADWIAKLDDFLRLSDRDILTHAGKISHEAAIKKAAVQKAQSEFAKLRQAQAALPQPVDVHFDQSLDELKQIEKQKNGCPRKRSRSRRVPAMTPDRMETRQTAPIPSISRIRLRSHWQTRRVRKSPGPIRLTGAPPLELILEPPGRRDARTTRRY
jgi:hypothetical protein